MAFRRRRPLCSLGCPLPYQSTALTGWSSGSGCPGASAHLAPSQTNQCGQYRLGGGQHSPLSGLSACLDGTCPGDSLRQAGGQRVEPGGPPVSAEPLLVLPWTCPSSPTGSTPSPNPAPQFSVSPSLRLATVLQNGGARGCAPGSRSGSMRSSGSTWRTSGSSPRRVPWRQRSPSVPGGGVLAEVSGRWGTAGPPKAPRRPAHSRAGGKVLPGAATQLCSPIPVAVLLRLVTGPMWGRWARARRPGLAEAGVGGAGVGNGARPTPYAPPRGPVAPVSQGLPQRPWSTVGPGPGCWHSPLPSVPLRLTENMRRLSKYPAWT